MPQTIHLRPHEAIPDGTQVFRVLQPYMTNYGWVSCKDFECEQYIGGYKLILPEHSDHADQMRMWLKNGFDPTTHGDGIKRAAQETVILGGLVEFLFEPGQACLKASAHRWHVRPPVFAFEKGTIRRYLKFDDFTDHMNNESDRVTRKE